MTPSVLDFLLARRSVPVKDLSDPGPDAGQIESILRAASRVPDHGKLCPWYFIVFRGDSRKRIAAEIETIFIKRNPGATTERAKQESARFLQTPVIVAVVSRIRKGKHPAWEQFLSAGAACQNLCLAANALGFSTNWLTGWLAYDETFRELLGLDDRDNIAGFIHIGTPARKPEDRERPDLPQIVTDWTPGASPNKGDIYEKAEFGLPSAGFSLPSR